MATRTVKSNSATVRLRGFWRRYKRNKGGLIGAVILAAIALAVIMAPVLTPYDPLRPGAGESFQPPSPQHPMGTDNLGRDILSGVLYGTEVSLGIAVVATLASTILGVLVGSVSGYFGGRVDDVLMRLTDVFIVMPLFIMALVITTLFGAKIYIIAAAIAIFAWPTTARLVRAEFLSLKSREFVDAARTIGVSTRNIVFSEILPNALLPVIVTGSLFVATAILMEVGLGFLGLGDPNTPSLGSMLRIAQLFLERAWWIALFPGLAITVITLSLNLVGDALNDALNPRLKGR